jgi:hypothetical protein
MSFYVYAIQEGVRRFVAWYRDYYSATFADVN